MNNRFIWQVRVYYEDTDAVGVVYYANYLKFFERARTEWLRALGFEQDKLRSEQGIIFAVRAVTVDYLRPARFNDLLAVSCSVEKLQKVSLVVTQEINYLSMDNHPPLCTAKIKLVCLDAQHLRLHPLPANIIQEIHGGE